MMADIHQLRPKAAAEPMIWVCDCGYSTFSLYSDGSAKCAACSAPHEGRGAGWLDRAAECRTQIAEGEVVAEVGGNGEDDLIRRRIAQQAAADGVALIVIGFEDGRLSAWSSAEPPEQFAWANDRLMRAAGLIAGRATNG